jgi:hypothetical protein
MRTLSMISLLGLGLGCWTTGVAAQQVDPNLLVSADRSDQLFQQLGASEPSRLSVESLRSSLTDNPAKDSLTAITGPATKTSVAVPGIAQPLGERDLQEMLR